MSWPALLGFGLAVLPICLTPGTSFTLVTSRVLDRGRRSGVLVAAGTASGILCHATLAALGLAAVVMRSSQLFEAVKLVGAAYLIGLGALTLYRAGRGRPGRPARRLPWSTRNDFVQGLLGNVLNPKAAAVYLTLAPQFLSPSRPLLPQVLALAIVHIVVAVAWLLTWTVVVGAARTVLRSPRFRRTMDRITGAVLIAFGIRTAATA